MSLLFGRLILYSQWTAFIDVKIDIGTPIIFGESLGTSILKPINFTCSDGTYDVPFQAVFYCTHKKQMGLKYVQISHFIIPQIVSMPRDMVRKPSVSVIRKWVPVGDSDFSLSHAHDMLIIPSFLISSPTLKFTIFLYLLPIGHFDIADPSSIAGRVSLQTQ